MTFPETIHGIPVIAVRLASHRTRDRATRIVERAMPDALHEYVNAYGSTCVQLFSVHTRATKGPHAYGEWIYLFPADLADEIDPIKGATLVKRLARNADWYPPFGQRIEL